MPKEQLPLALKTAPDLILGNFIAGDNGAVVEEFTDIAVQGGEASIHCWGKSGSGKSHLLQALAAEARSANRTAIYLPLQELSEHAPTLLEGMEAYQLLLVDDIDCIAGRRDWEEALFGLCNQLRAAGHSLIAAGRTPLDKLQDLLPDLKTRLQWGGSYRLKPLLDEQLATLLAKRCELYGFELTERAAGYLLNRASRNAAEIVRLAGLLDQRSLSKQQRVTLKLVKEVL